MGDDDCPHRSYSTIMTVAVPAIFADLTVDFGPLQWAIDIYTIVLAALLVAVGDIVVVLLLLADGSSGMSVMTVTAVFILAAALLIIREHRATSPLFATSLVTSRMFGAVVLVAAVYYFAAFGPLPLLSQWLQEGVGQSVVSTSLILSAQPVVFCVVSAAAGTQSGRGARHDRAPGLGVAVPAVQADVARLFSAVKSRREPAPRPCRSGATTGRPDSTNLTNHPRRTLTHHEREHGVHPV